MKNTLFLIIFAALFAACTKNDQNEDILMLSGTYDLTDASCDNAQITIVNNGVTTTGTAEISTTSAAHTLTFNEDESYSSLGTLNLLIKANFGGTVSNLDNEVENIFGEGTWTQLGGQLTLTDQNNADIQVEVISHDGQTAVLRRTIVLESADDMQNTKQSITGSYDFTLEKQ